MLEFVAFCLMMIGCWAIGSFLGDVFYVLFMKHVIDKVCKRLEGELDDEEP